MKNFFKALFLESGFTKLAYLILGILLMFGKGEFFEFLSAAAFGIFFYVNANVIIKFVKSKVKI